MVCIEVPILFVTELFVMYIWSFVKILENSSVACKEFGTETIE